MAILPKVASCGGRRSGEKGQIGIGPSQFLRVKGNGVKMRLGADEEDR
jgi:hypothetical protein